jgi:hypothetical protein
VTRIAVLDSGVRLVVFQFLMKTEQVPAIIPQKRASTAPPLTPVSGVEVLRSTPKVNLLPLIIEVVAHGNYELVDSWQDPHKTNWKMSSVWFVYCHREHLKRDELYPDFVAQKENLERVFSDFVRDNLWATQAHLNPYFENGMTGSQKVLMLGCAGRVPDTEVFSGGRDVNNRGIGPKVLLSSLSHRITLDNGEVILEAPSSLPETVPSLVV